MARVQALSIFTTTGERAQLDELFGNLVINITRNTLSSGLRARTFSVDPMAGSAEFDRFADSVVKDEETARTAGKGDKLKTNKITVRLDQMKEIVEEINIADMNAMRSTRIMLTRYNNHIRSMARLLDTSFFAEAVNAGTAFTTSETDTDKILSAFITNLELVKNEFVQGINRSDMELIAEPSFYDKIRILVDGRANPNVDTAAEEFFMYHGVRVYSSVNLPVGTKAVLMTTGSVAQPLAMFPYNEPRQIPFSNNFYISLFFRFGTKALTPDLIFTY